MSLAVVLQFSIQHDYKLLLYFLLDKNYSFFIVIVMSAVNVTVTPAFSYDCLCCVMSFIKHNYGIFVLSCYIFSVLVADISMYISTGPWDAVKTCPTI